MLINRKTNIVFHQERYLHSLIHLFLVFLLSHYHSFPAEPFLNWTKKKARFKRNRTIAIGQQYYATNKTKEKLFSSILKKKKKNLLYTPRYTWGNLKSKMARTNNWYFETVHYMPFSREPQSLWILRHSPTRRWASAHARKTHWLTQSP